MGWFVFTLNGCIDLGKINLIFTPDKIFYPMFVFLYYLTMKQTK